MAMTDIAEDWALAAIRYRMYAERSDDPEDAQGHKKNEATAMSHARW